MIKAKGELSIFGPCLPYFQELASSIRRKVGDLEGIDNLNQVGVRIWELIDGKRQVEEIRDLIVAEFEVSQEEAEKDPPRSFSSLLKSVLLTRFQ